jgi:glycerophosphoryl diester phosphodiesterase
VFERSFSQDARRLIVAHRGASANEAENTLPAFEDAIAAGADVVEFDVRMTADGAAVVMHDPDVARTTDGRGLVRDLTLLDLRRLRVATTSGGTTEVPTLEEVLRTCSGRIAVDIEIKNVPGEPDFDGEKELAVEATIRALDDVAFVGVVLISSFNPFSIARARAMAPDVPTGLLADRSVDAHAALGYAHEQGHPWVLPFLDAVREAGPALAQEAHDLGMRLGTWITDDPGVAVTLWRDGVDAVATNDPVTMVAARAEVGPS